MSVNFPGCDEVMIMMANVLIFRTCIKEAVMGKVSWCLQLTLKWFIYIKEIRKKMLIFKFVLNIQLIITIFDIFHSWGEET